MSYFREHTLYHHPPFHYGPGVHRRHGNSFLGGHPSYFRHPHGPGAAHGADFFFPGPLHFLKKMAAAVFAFFAFSMMFRMVAIFFSVLLSPPVLFFAMAAWMFAHHQDNAMDGPAKGGKMCFGPGACCRRMHRFRTMMTNHFGGGCGKEGRKCWNKKSSSKCCPSPADLKNNCVEERKGAAAGHSTEDYEVLLGHNPREDNQDVTSTTPHQEQEAPARSHLQDSAVHRDETEERLTLAFDVPGFSPSDIHVSVDNDDRLVIEGSRTNRVGDTFHIQETFTLDQEVYILDSIEGNFSDGVLEVTISKKPPVKPRVISISTTRKEE